MHHECSLWVLLSLAVVDHLDWFFFITKVCRICEYPRKERFPKFTTTLRYYSSRYYWRGLAAWFVSESSYHCELKAKFELVCRTLLIFKPRV